MELEENKMAILNYKRYALGSDGLLQFHKKNYIPSNGKAQKLIMSEAMFWWVKLTSKLN